MIAVDSVDELSGDAQSIAPNPHAALEHRVDLQAGCDFADVLILELPVERGRARGHPYAFKVRERVCQLFGESIAEIVVLLVAAYVGEWQHDNRGFVGQRKGLGVRG